MDTFFTAIGCMDGRVQDLIARYGREQFDALYPDTITEPGFIGVLAKRALDEEFVNHFSQELFISISNHGSKGVIVHAHANCAGNPVDNEQQKKEVQEAAMLIKSLVQDTPVIGIFINRDERDHSQWSVEEVISLI